MLSHYSRLAKKPVQAAGVRCLAQVTNARVEPFLLEDMTQYKNGNEEELAPFVISRRRGFLPRKVKKTNKRRAKKSVKKLINLASFDCRILLFTCQRHFLKLTHC